MMKHISSVANITREAANYRLIAVGNGSPADSVMTKYPTTISLET
jgi:hypothetical protein